MITPFVYASSISMMDMVMMSVQLTNQEASCDSTPLTTPSLAPITFPTPLRLHREVTAERRHKEADALLQVKDVLPLSQAQLDQANQASILSLAISYMRLREMMDNAGTNYGE